MEASVKLRRFPGVVHSLSSGRQQRHVGHQLVELYDAYVKFLRERTRSRLMNLNLTQWRTLTLIRFNPHQTQRALAHAVGVDPSSMTSIINFFERKGWVARRRSRKNRSAYYLSMTTTGLRVYRELERELGRSERLFEATLGRGWYSALGHLLEALQQRLARELTPVDSRDASGKPRARHARPNY